MPRPKSVSEEDLLRWSEIIDNDPIIPASMSQNYIIREVCYAGQWLSEKLSELECPDHLITRMMFSAGRACFGRPDPWAVHQEMLEQFINGTLEFEMETDEMN